MQQSASVSITLTVASVLTVSSSVILPSAVAGQSYTADLGAALSPSGGVPPYTYTSPALPPGFTLTTAGVLSGVPIAAGTLGFSVTVADSGTP